jgi:hypothetical protein
MLGGMSKPKSSRSSSVVRRANHCEQKSEKK